MDLEVKGKENATKIDHKAAEAKEKKKSADSDASVETKRSSLHSLRVDAGKLADTRNSENVSTEESDGKKGAVRTSVSRTSSNRHLISNKGMKFRLIRKLQSL